MKGHAFFSTNNSQIILILTLKPLLWRTFNTLAPYLVLYGNKNEIARTTQI